MHKPLVTNHRWMAGWVSCWCLWVAVLVAPAAAAAPAPAKPAATPAPEPAWKTERERLRAIVEQRLQDRIRQTVDPRAVAEGIGIAWPVTDPTMSREKALTGLDAEVAAEVERRCPPVQVKTLEAEARKKFPLYRPGDRAAFVIRGGKGMNSSVEGCLHLVTDERIRIGERWVLRSDMEEMDLAKFDPELNKARVENYVQRRVSLAESERDDLRTSLTKAKGGARLTAAGYVYLPRRKIWVSTREAFDQELLLRRQAAEKTLRPQIEKEVFQASDYVFAGGEWKPKSAVAAAPAAKPKPKPKPR